MSSDIFLINLWRRSAGLPEIEANPVDFNKLKKTEWSPEFEQLMRNRLIIGAFRYGRLGDPLKPDWDRLKRIEYEVEQYRKDGNDERLVDIANMCLLEFVEGKHPKKHFHSLDDVTHNSLTGR